MTPPAQPNPIRIRCILLGLLLIPLNAYWVFQIEGFWLAGWPTTISLFFNVVLILMAVTLLNAALRNIAPAYTLNAAELVTLYAMLCMSSAVTGLDFVMVVLPLLAHHIHGATPENNWAELFDGKLPLHLLVTSKEAISNFYEGKSSFYLPENFQPWIAPVLIWTGFLTTLIFTTMCLNIIFLKEWTQKERLAFPIVELPLAIATRPKELCWNSRFLWGLLIAGSITMLNGLHSYDPELFPAIPIRAYDINLSSLFRGLGSPWNAVGWFPISWYPCVIGLSFLMPLDLMFSCWFFFLFWKFEQVIFASFGVTPMLPKDYITQQATGSYLAITAGAIWIGREHLKRVMDGVIHGHGEELGGTQLNYRLAALGSTLGFIALVGFGIWAGISPVLSIIYFVLYLGLAMGIARMRATCGPPAHDLHFAGPGQIFVNTIGSENLDGNSLGAFALFFGFNRAYRGHPTAHSVEGFRLAEQTRGPIRMMFIAQALAVMFGCLCAFWVFLHVSYEAQTGAPRITYSRGYEAYGIRLQKWLTAPAEVNPLSWIFYVGGFLAVALMPLLKLKFPGLPFHPIGLAVSSSWSMHLVWLPIFIGWFCKTTIVKYTGGSGYRRCLPFFMGLIVGDYIVGGLWTMATWMLEKRLYSFWY
ncbi:MAG: hypothetical protein QGF00_30275 [Planctomycetota bacterium]|jgi:hypothetical protein|nr:hypothetical protein [Planctomycetota bacterium]